MLPTSLSCSDPDLVQGVFIESPTIATWWSGNEQKGRLKLIQYTERIIFPVLGNCFVFADLFASYSSLKLLI